MRMTAELYDELSDLNDRIKLLFKEIDPIESIKRSNFMSPYQQELQAYKIKLENLYSDFELKEESNSNLFNNNHIKIELVKVGQNCCITASGRCRGIAF